MRIRKDIFKNVLKSLLIISFFTTGLFAKYLNNSELKSELNRNKAKELKKLGYYIINGFYSRNDVKDFIKTYNKVFDSIKFPIVLDENLLLKNTYGKNGTIYATIETMKRNKADFIKTCKKFYKEVGIKNPTNINLKKCLTKLDNVIIDANLFQKCKEVYGKNFYKYGGKIKYILEDKFLNKTFNKSVESDKDCDEIKEDMLKTFKSLKDNK